MPSFAEALTPEQRWAITDYIASLSGERRARLHQPRRRQVRSRSDRFGEGRRELRVRSRGPLSDHRTDHGARTPVPSSRDLGDGPGHLRRGVNRGPRSMARHGSGQHGEERSDASRADRRGRGGDGARCAPRAAPRRSGGGPTRGRGRSLCRDERPGSSAIGVHRRGRDPDSDAGTDGRPQAVLHLRRRPEPGRSLVLRSGPQRAPSVHRPGKRGHRAERHGDVTGVASYDQGEWSVIFKRPLRPSAGAAFVPGEFLPIAFSVWDGFSRDRGNRRGLTSWYSIYVEPEVVPSAVGPMVRTALIILVIELAVIGLVRRRYALDARGDARREPSHPAATRV